MPAALSGLLGMRGECMPMSRGELGAAKPIVRIICGDKGRPGQGGKGGTPRGDPASTPTCWPIIVATFPIFFNPAKGLARGECVGDVHGGGRGAGKTASPLSQLQLAAGTGSSTLACIQDSKHCSTQASAQAVLMLRAACSQGRHACRLLTIVTQRHMATRNSMSYDSCMRRINRLVHLRRAACIERALHPCLNASVLRR